MVDGDNDVIAQQQYNAKLYQLYKTERFDSDMAMAVQVTLSHAQKN